MSCIVKRAIAQIIEHGLHAVGMSLADIRFDDTGVDFAIGNVGIAVLHFAVAEHYGFVVFILPVIELQTVDVATVEQCCFLADGFRGFGIVVGAHEAIARIACPVGRHIYSDGAVDSLLATGIGSVYISEVARVVCGGWRP